MEQKNVERGRLAGRLATIIVIAAFFMVVMAGSLGAWGVTNFGSIHLADTNATATPVFMVNSTGSSVIAEFRDSGTPVAQIVDGGSFIMSAGFDFNGQTVTIDADADTALAATVDDEITTTLGAATGSFGIATGNLRVGNGTNGVTLNGEDAYIEGTLEVDGLTTLDGGADFNAASVILDADADTTLIASIDDIVTYTIGAATGSVDIATGNFKVGDGTPAFTQNGEDAYIEGTTELAGDVIVGAQTSISVVLGGVPITPTGMYQPIISAVETTGATVNDVGAPADDTTGKLLILHNINATQVITIDGTGGTVECKSNVALAAQDTLVLLWNGTNWICLSTYDNS